MNWLYFANPHLGSRPKGAHRCDWVRVRVCMRVRVCACVRVRVQVRARVLASGCGRARGRVHVRVCKRVCVCVCVCAREPKWGRLPRKPAETPRRHRGDPAETTKEPLSFSRFGGGRARAHVRSRWVCACVRACVGACTWAFARARVGACMRAWVRACHFGNMPVLTATPACLPSHLLIDLVIEW